MSGSRLLGHSETSECRGPLRLVRRMPGSTQSLLVRSSDEKLWVMKRNNYPVGSNLLANELMGAHFLGVLGIPSPSHAVYAVPDTFFDDERTWLDSAAGRTRPLPGLHFMSRFLPCTTGTRAVEGLPTALEEAFSDVNALSTGIFTFDIWSMHADRRQALFLTKKGRFQIVFIDNSHLFGGPHWSPSMMERHSRSDSSRRCLWEADHVVMRSLGEQDELDEWILRMQLLLPEAIDSISESVPAEWYSGCIRTLCRVLHQRLTCLDLLTSEAYEVLQQHKHSMRSHHSRIWTQQHPDGNRFSSPGEWISLRRRPASRI